MGPPTRWIEATTDAGAAARHVWDVVVVGAGPAGAVAALRLARDGLRVLLVDKAGFPRPKVCGCCLNASALGTLARAGLGSLPARHGARELGRVSIRADGREARLALPRGVALSRERLDAALVGEAVAAGAEFLPGCTALVRADGSVDCRTAGIGVRVEARAAIVADGLAGHGADSIAGLETYVDPRSRIGCGTVVDGATRAYEAGTIHMAVGDGGYLGVVRLEDDRLGTAAAFDPGYVRRAGGPGLAATRIMSDAGMPMIPGLAGARWKGTAALTRRRRRLQAGPVFVIGDAAGYVEPFTGEGMAWAMGSGEAVAPLVVRAARRGVSPGADEWTAVHRREFGPAGLRCRAVAWALRRPRLARWAVSGLRVRPALAGPMVRTINRMAEPDATPSVPR